MLNEIKVREMLGGRAERYKSLIRVVLDAPENLVPELIYWIKRFDSCSSRINGAIATELLGWIKAGLSPEKYVFATEKDLADIMMLDRFSQLEVAEKKVCDNGLELFSDDTFFVNSGSIFCAIEEAGFNCPDLYAHVEYEFNFEKAFFEV